MLKKEKKYTKKLKKEKLKKVKKKFFDFLNCWCGTKIRCGRSRANKPIFFLPYMYYVCKDFNNLFWVKGHEQRGGVVKQF